MKASGGTVAAHLLPVTGHEASIEERYKQFLRAANLTIVLPVAMVLGFVAHLYFGGPGTATATSYTVIALAAVRAAIVTPGFHAVLWGSLAPRRAIAWAILAGLVAPVIAGALTVALSALVPRIPLAIGVPGVPNPVVFHPLTVTSFALPLVLAPIAETALFQVWLQSALARTPWLSLVIGSVAFLAAHLEVSPMLVVTLCGLCALRAFSRSSGAVVIAHSLANGLVFVVFFLSQR